MVRRAVQILIALFVLGLIRSGYTLFTDWRASPYSAANLRATSEEMNKMLPAFIGTEMQLVHTSASEGRLVYQLRLINYKGNGKELRSPTVAEQLRSTACGNEKARDLLSHQVHVLYQVEASDGRPIVSIEVGPTDCGA